MLFPHGETVTRQRPAEEIDPYSDEPVAQDWAATYDLDIEGCAFDPGASLEPLEAGRTAVVTRPRVYAPPGSDILAGDRIKRANDEVYEVDGDPAAYVSPFTGWAPGLVVSLVKVDG